MPTATGSPAALVFGANGISGTAMLQALTEQSPSANKFKKIIPISRRPPQMKIDDSRMQFLSIDILKSDLNEIIQKLKDAGYIDVIKQFKDNYPQTICSITTQGVSAFEQYVKNLQGYLKP